MDTYYCVEIQGKDVSDLLSEIKVEESDTQADLATLRFTDSHLILQDMLQEGITIEIDLGDADNHALLFRGMVTSVRPTIPSQGEPQVEVEAMNSLIKLALEAKTYSWWNKTISQIVKEIAQQNKLRPGRIEPDEDAELSNIKPRQQIEETDLAFLLRLAQDYDCRLYIKHEDAMDTLNFVSAKTLLQEQPIEIPMAFNANLGDFSITADSFAVMPEVTLISTDPTTGELLTLEESAGSTDGTWEPDPDRIAQLQDGAERMTQLATETASLRKNLDTFHQTPPRIVGAPARPTSDRAGTFGDRAHRLGQKAQGRTHGSVSLQPRRVINVEGYGGRWSGKWYLAEVEHQLDIAQNRYTTSFTCTR